MSSGFGQNVGGYEHTGYMGDLKISVTLDDHDYILKCVFQDNGQAVDYTI